MSLIHNLTPRCSLLLAPLSVCLNGKNTSHTFRDRQKGLDTHSDSSQLLTLSVMVLFHFVILTMHFLCSNYLLELK